MRRDADLSVVTTGVEMGGVLAMIVSYSVNHSIWWAILHGFCSWGYVVYFAFWR